MKPKNYKWQLEFNENAYRKDTKEKNWQVSSIRIPEGSTRSQVRKIVKANPYLGDKIQYRVVKVALP